eukprot:6371789-Amphidinium_carterae.1
MEWARADNREWSACDNARGYTTQQWTGHDKHVQRVNHALFGHNDSRSSRHLARQSSSLTSLTMTMS